MLLNRLAAVSDPLRARMLAILAQEELAVGELTKVLQLPQSTVSRHLKVLESSGWVERRTEGTRSHVRFIEHGSDIQQTLWNAVLHEVCDTPEVVADRLRLTAIIAARATDSRTFFGQIHEGWDSVRRDLFGDGFLLPTLLGLVDPNLVVADLGCGTGGAVALLAPHLKRVIGVDREQKMLDIAAQRTAAAHNIELRCGRVTELPLPDDSVDATLCMLVLHHVEDTETALAEMARVLRPTGRAVVLDMVAHNRAEYRASMGHVHQGFDPDVLAADAARVGLRTVRMTPLPPSLDAQAPPLFLAVFQNT